MIQPDKLVSIIVPVYNAGPYIQKTIDMVCAQTFQEWELILVDDCSRDNSRELMRQRSTGSEGRIRLIEKEENEGAARARNTGVEAARGRYIAFLDADDVWMPDKLEKELAFMERQQAAFVFTAYEFGDRNARGTGKVVHVPARLTYTEALSRTVIFTTTVLIDTCRIRRELVLMPDVKSEDTATWWRILRSGVVACGLDEVLAIYRRPEKSLSSNKLEAIKRIWKLYREEEKLSLWSSAYHLFFWAVRATRRRL